MFALSLTVAAFVASVSPSPTPTTSYDKRDIISSLTSSLPSGISNGILPVFGNLPDADTIKDKLDISDDQVANVAVSVMNIPGYGNWTSDGWHLRVHGQAYKIPPLTDDQLDNAAGIFVPGLDIDQLNDTQKALARNVTGSILNIPQPDITLPFQITLKDSSIVNFTFPLPTDPRGEFDQFIPLPQTAPVPNGSGKGEAGVVKLDVLTNDTMTGNATAYLVPEEGLTIVSDIDDILRVTQIYDPAAGLRNSFAYPYQSWANMPQIYNNWASQNEMIHFHYLTTLPEQVTRAYESYIYSSYPLGSFDTRPLNFTTQDQILQVRMVALTKVIQTYPKRKFVLVGDTSNGDVMRDYPALVSMFPGQISCILIRNTSATDSADHFPYDTSGFQNVSTSLYMFFVTPDDLKDLDLTKGDCVNNRVPQNVTFELQGKPFSGALASFALERVWLAVLSGLVAVALGIQL